VWHCKRLILAYQIVLGAHAHNRISWAHFITVHGLSSDESFTFALTQAHLWSLCSIHWLFRGPGKGRRCQGIICSERRRSLARLFPASPKHLWSLQIRAVNVIRVRVFLAWHHWGEVIYIFGNSIWLLFWFYIKLCLILVVNVLVIVVVVIEGGRSDHGLYIQNTNFRITPRMSSFSVAKWWV